MGRRLGATKRGRTDSRSHFIHSFIHFGGASPMRTVIGRDSMRVRRSVGDSRRATRSGNSRSLRRIGREYGVAFRFARLGERFVLSAVATTYVHNSKFLFP